MKAKISEIRTAIVLVFITVAVCVAGLLLYKNLTFISEEVSESYRKESLPSETVREMTSEFRDADNYIKSYNLTHNDEYLIYFFKSISVIQEKAEELEKKVRFNSNEKAIIDSITLLCEERFALMKKQLFLDDQKNVTNELNVISRKIKETNKTSSPVAVSSSAPPETLKAEKTGFFNRLFSKKKKAKAIEESKSGGSVTNIKTQQEIDSIAAEIDATVQYVKQRQFSKIQNRQNIEMKAETESKIIMDRIHLLYLKLEESEQRLAGTKIDTARQKVNETKNLGIIVSVIISALLLTVSWFIIFYSRRKAQYEAALVKAKQEAEDLAKTKEMFLANMSHEIKTPLNAIYGFTDQVLQTEIPSKQKEQLTIVKKSATHLINLITDILNYSKIQSGRMSLELQDFNLKEELHEIELLFKSITDKKNVPFIIEISHTVPQNIRGDLTKFKQVLMNIVGNAIKFTERGHVKLVIEKTESNQEKPLLLITISDTGIGIPTDKLPKLFNEYEQAHSGLSQKYGGTGLGLVITQKLVELMGGTIRLESEEDKGTQAFIQIPLLEGNEPVKNKTNGNIHAESLHSKKVLIADDEEYNRLLLKTILSKYKVQVYEAADGSEAITLLKSQPVDLVLMDLNMPIKNGIDACKEIRKLPGMDKEHLSILVSSAVQNEDKAEELRRAGFNGSLFKPFTEEELIHKLVHFTSHTKPEEPVLNIVPTKKQSEQHKLNFENIESISDGDTTFKKELINIFHRSINQGTEQLIDACNRESWQEVSDLAHKMMPPCKHFEADHLYNILDFFEHIPENGTSQPAVQQKLGELSKEVQLVNSELEIYL